MGELCNGVKLKIEYPLTFKAAILEENNKPLTVDKVTFNGPLKTGQVLVRIHYSGICGKQIEEIKASAGKDPYLPHMLGHEGSGIIVDIGPDVSKVAPGDHVVLHWVKGQGIDAETPEYSKNGEKINAGWITTFNEYGVISENRLTKISKEIDLNVASLLGCAATTGIGVIVNEAKVRPNESVGVFGCGGVGLSAILGAKLAKSFPIIGVDKHNDSLKLARKIGATHIINSTEKDITTEIKNITDGEGVNYVIITAANPKFIEESAQSSSIPGSVFVVAVPN